MKGPGWVEVRPRPKKRAPDGALFSLGRLPEEPSEQIEAIAL